MEGDCECSNSTTKTCCPLCCCGQKELCSSEASCAGDDPGTLEDSKVSKEGDRQMITRAISKLGKFITLPDTVERIDKRISSLWGEVVLKDTCTKCHEGIKDRMDLIIEMLRNEVIQNIRKLNEFSSERQPKKN